MVRLAALAALPALIPLALMGGPDTGESGEGEWIAVPAQSLAIEAGSALDFSALVPEGPAASSGPLTLADGRLAFAQGGRPARFNCAMLANGPNGVWDLPAHQEADALAEQLRRHGYDLVRFHFIDARLMRHATRDFQVDAGDLDRFHYLLAALKKRGIYWMLDVQTAFDAGVAGGVKNKLNPNSLKIRLNFDPAARAHWVRLLETIYGEINPYTGMTPLADPALAFVIGANENSIAFGSLGDPGRFSKGLAPVFNRWLRQRYRTVEALSTALPDLSAVERDGGEIALPPSWSAVGPRAALFLRFVADQEIDTYHWMSAQLARHGFHGPLLGYPEWYSEATGETRARLPITDIHAYLGEVTSYALGTQLKLPSSTSDAGLNNLTANAAARWLDRPMVASEYGMPIPNPYRYESGIAYPALAARQGYSTICRMASMTVEPAILSPGGGAKAMLGYSIGIDPVSRAAETLSALLFYRGDVRQEVATVAVPFGPREFMRPGAAFLPAGLRRAALLARFGLVAPNGATAVPPPVRLVPINAEEYTSTINRLSNAVFDHSAEQLARLTAELRENGTLPPSNRTDVMAGLLQSGTGEVTVDQPNGRLTVITPRTEAMSVTRALSGPVTLRQLSVRILNAGALVAASALDGRPLAESRRILLILSGDAMNSGMQMSGYGVNRQIVAWGRLPIRMRRVNVQLSLKTFGTEPAHLSVLSLSGKVLRSQSLAVEGDNTLHFTLDTGAVTANPTTFFLLERGTPSTAAVPGA